MAVTNLTHSESNLSTTATFTGTSSGAYVGLLIAWGDSSTTTGSMLTGSHTYSHTYASAGTYTVTLRGTYGNTDQGSYSATVPPPSVGGTSPGPGSNGWPSTETEGGSELSPSSGIAYNGFFY